MDVVVAITIFEFLSKLNDDDNDDDDDNDEVQQPPVYVTGRQRESEDE